MGASALSDLLVDFGARQRPPAPVAPVLAPMPILHVEMPPPPPDIGAIVAEAVAAAEAAVAARFQEELEQRLAEERERHEAELELVRSELGVELGNRLAAGLAELERATIDASTSVTARILSQVATDTLAARAVAALAATVRDAIADPGTIRIRVKGPQSLFLPFAAAMGEQSRHLEFSESAATDLTVAIDDTLFTTRLAEWSAALSEAVP